MAKKRVSRPSLAPAARQDIREVLRWSEQNFGETAAARYRALIKQAVRDIGADPERPGSKERPEIMIQGARTTYHLSFSRSRLSGPGVKEPRHFLLYRRREDGVIEVARILHDGRDLGVCFFFVKMVCGLCFFSGALFLPAGCFDASAAWIADFAHAWRRKPLPLFGVNGFHEAELLALLLQ